jgi:hypothetical protein
MAVNQVSLYFYPPRRPQRRTSFALARADQGKPDQIANAPPVENAEGQAVLPVRLKE